MSFPSAPEDIPYISTRQMIEVDRAMIEDVGIALIQMMENAGRALAHLARERFLAGDPQGKRVTLMAGSGGNGGGALVCARRLHNYGAQVTVVTSKAGAAFSPIPAYQFRILEQMGVPLRRWPTEEQPPELIIDGLVGYSLKGAPRGMVAELIGWANSQPAPVLSLDIPSGVDGSAGAIHKPAVQADATLTLALPKEGLRAAGAPKLVGELYLADISVPPSLYQAMGLPVGSLFARGDILRLHR